MSIRLVCRAVPLVALVLLAGCATGPSVKRMSETECLARAMYFESNRSSEEGMIAVGTVVMNRVNSPQFPDSVCAVVGQKNQFAPGVLSKPMAAGKELAFRSAQKVIRGSRHGQVGGKSLFFHTAGYSFPYNNMHYVAIAGGNAFYEKRKDAHVTQEQIRQRSGGRMATPAASPASRTASAAPARRSRQAPARPAAPGPALEAMSIEDVIAMSGGAL